MLNGIVKITNINYEAAIASLLSRISEKSDKGDSLPVRLLQKLGDDTENVLRALLNYIPDAKKGKLICELANHYEEKICSKLNEGLASRDLGQDTAIEKILFQESEEGLTICLQNVRLDYQALLGNEAVQKKMGDTVEQYVNQSSLGRIPGLAGFLKEKADAAARAAVHLAPEMIEKKALELVNASGNKEKLSGLLENSLKKQGLMMDIAEIEVYKADACSEEAADESEEQSSILSEEMEELLLNAAAELLKDLSRKKS